MYSADVSAKIKSVYHARFQQGKFMEMYKPYGYVKDPADHNHLLSGSYGKGDIRPSLARNGFAKIRKHLNKQRILHPDAMRRSVVKRL